MLEKHAVVGSDREGVIRIWTDGATKLFGHEPEAAIGESLNLLIPPAFRDRHWPAFHAAVATGVSRYDGIVFADPIVHADGSVVIHRGRFALMKDAEGVTIGAISTWGPPRPEDQGFSGPRVVRRDASS